MSDSKDAPLTINGWTVYFHPLFLEALEELIRQVEILKQKDPDNYRNKKPAKLLAAIYKLAFQDIPQDPTLPDYRQGNTLGDDHKHWFRAKFYQQYRLFFRYHEEGKIIVFAWVNNEDTKRAYGSNSDAYAVFRKMLRKGNPPDNWDTLIKEAKKPSKYHVVVARIANSFR